MLSASTGYCGILKKRVLRLSPAVDMLEHIMDRLNKEDSQEQSRLRHGWRMIATVVLHAGIDISPKGG